MESFVSTLLIPLYIPSIPPAKYQQLFPWVVVLLPLALGLCFCFYHRLAFPHILLIPDWVLKATLEARTCLDVYPPATNLQSCVLDQSHVE